MGNLSAANVAGPMVATILILLSIVICIAWIVLPFAMIGTKSLLRELIAETKRTNALLESEARVRARSSDVAAELNSFRPER